MKNNSYVNDIPDDLHSIREDLVYHEQYGGYFCGND